MNAFQVMMTSSKKKSKDSKKKKSVFDVLMSNRTTSTTKSKRKGRRPIFKRKKKSKQKSFPPKHKRVKLTKELLVLVDAFEYAIPHVQKGIVLNMLTHFHSDHYGGLDKNYSSKVQILCNEITGNLAAQELRVCKSHLRILPMNTYVPLSNRVDVAMIDANHCPGAAIALFRVKQKESFRYVLHTGDFRYTPKCHLCHPLLSSICIDTVYLDDTYCGTSHRFPNQDLVLSQVKNAALREVSKYKRVLFLFGAYAIGKEKVFLTVAEQFKQSKIFVERSRKRRFELFKWSKKLLARFTNNPSVSNIHVVTMGKCRDPAKYAEKWSKRYDAVVTFVPTGWTFKMTGAKNIKWFQRPNRRTHGTLQIVKYLVPYSEHSSFDELVQFVNDFNPKTIVCTVNVSRQDYSVKLLRGEATDRRVNGDYDDDDDDDQEAVVLDESKKKSDLGRLLSIAAD
eukprot:g231.t1